MKVFQFKRMGVMNQESTSTLCRFYALCKLQTAETATMARSAENAHPIVHLQNASAALGTNHSYPV